MTTFAKLLCWMKRDVMWSSFIDIPWPRMSHISLEMGTLRHPVDEATFLFINLIISVSWQVFLDYFISLNKRNILQVKQFFSLEFEILKIIYKSFHEYFTISKLTITVIWKWMVQKFCFDLFDQILSHLLMCYDLN